MRYNHNDRVDGFNPAVLVNMEIAEIETVADIGLPDMQTLNYAYALNGSHRRYMKFMDFLKFTADFYSNEKSLENGLH